MMTLPSFLQAVAALLTLAGANAQGFPGCVESNAVFRHAGAHAIFVDVSLHATAGCWQNDCKNTDKWNADNHGVCARVCHQIDDCHFWSYGEQEGVTKCFLRKSDGGREQAQGWSSGKKDCSPPSPPSSQVALHSATIPALEVCDAGKSDACPDMARAISTWKFAISHLKKATEGQLDANTMQYVTQIATDTDAFAGQPTEENFPVVIGNNRQVFNALRGWLDSQPKVDIDGNDASLPNPLRGELCGTASCYER